MRWIVTLAIIVLCVAGGAFAQDEPLAETRSFIPVFEPRSDHGGRAYPRRALEERVAGIVHLCCRAREDRSLDCDAAVEWPANRGFAGAALTLIREAKLTQDSYGDLQSRAQHSFRMPIRWQVSPAPEALEEAARQIEEQTQDLCGPGTGRANPADYIRIEASRL
jgi:hypothetical protein